MAAPSAHADWRFRPGLDIRETWTDNVDLLPGEQAQTQLISEVAPSFLFTADSRRLKATASGSFRQFAYRDGDSVRARNDHVKQYAANLQGVLAEDLLFVDARASASQRNLSAFGPLAEDTPYTSRNSTEVRTWSLSPYLTHNFGRSATAIVRFTRDAVESDARSRFGNSTADTVLVDLNNHRSRDKLSWGLNYQNQDQENEIAGGSSVENVKGNLRYRLDSSLALTATAGYDRYEYDSLGGVTAGRNWSAGFAWTPSQRTSIEASFGRHFYGATGSLAASVRSRHTVWSVSYGDTITNSRQQFTLPSAIDTTALIDRLFSATIPDPVQRQLAVAAYIRAAGLPPSLADSINYLSNRYMRQKLLQASATFRGARSNAVVSMYGSERTALTSQETDSALLGSQLAALNDNVRQRGASATFTYNLNSRSILVANASYGQSKSLTTGVENRQRLLRLGMERKLGQHLSATLEARRRSGGFDAASPRRYTEHAIVAGLSMTL